MSRERTSREPLPAAAALRTTAPSYSVAGKVCQTAAEAAAPGARVALSAGGSSSSGAHSEACGTGRLRLFGDWVLSHRVFGVDVCAAVEQQAARLQVAEERAPVESAASVELPPLARAAARRPDDVRLRAGREQGQGTTLRCIAGDRRMCVA